MGVVHLTESELKNLLQDIDQTEQAHAQTVDALKIEKLQAQINAIKARESLYTTRAQSIQRKQLQQAERSAQQAAEKAQKTASREILAAWLITFLCVLVDLLILSFIVY